MLPKYVVFFIAFAWHLHYERKMKRLVVKEQNTFEYPEFQNM